MFAAVQLVEPRSAPLARPPASAAATVAAASPPVQIREIVRLAPDRNLPFRSGVLLPNALLTRFMITRRPRDRAARPLGPHAVKHRNLHLLEHVTEPERLHVIDLFSHPPRKSLAGAAPAGLEPTELHGSRPRFTWPLWRMLVTRRVGPDLTFRFTRSTKLGYTGTRASSPDAQR